jgi:Protein of unknown function (DUF2630)
MQDRDVITRIDELVAEEHTLRDQAAGTGLDDAARARLAEIEASLDQCWDLLRQRRAQVEYGENPDLAAPRPVDAVESYEQ